MVIYFGGVSLVFILQLNIYSEKGGEPERMLGDYFESSGKLQVNSRIFQRVEVPSGRIFQRYSVF